jgi:hypothetical protein
MNSYYCTHTRCLIAAGKSASNTRGVHKEETIRKDTLHYCPDCLGLLRLGQSKRLVANAAFNRNSYSNLEKKREKKHPKTRRSKHIETV